MLWRSVLDLIWMRRNEADVFGARRSRDIELLSRTADCFAESFQDAGTASGFAPLARSKSLAFDSIGLALAFATGNVRLRLAFPGYARFAAYQNSHVRCDLLRRVRSRNLASHARLWVVIPRRHNHSREADRPAPALAPAIRSRRLLFPPASSHFRRGG